MEEYRKNVNIQIGRRLKEARENLGRTQAEIAFSFGISDEHYRKYESGATGLSADKLLILYKEYGIDPTYLITGECMKERFNVDYYIANCSKELGMNHIMVKYENKWKVFVMRMNIIQTHWHLHTGI